MVSTIQRELQLMFWYCFFLLFVLGMYMFVCGTCACHISPFTSEWVWNEGLTLFVPKSPHPKYISHVVWVLLLWLSFFKNEIMLFVKDSSSTRRWCLEGFSMGQSALRKTKLRFCTNLASWTMIAKSHRAPVENFLSLPSSHEPCWMGQWQARFTFQLSNQTRW